MNKIYLFGNSDVSGDDVALDIVPMLKKDFPPIDFIEVRPNEELPFDENEDVVLLDAVMGIDRVKILSEEEIAHLSGLQGISAHDYDLGFQLKYMKKLGKLGTVKIIGIPLEKADSDEVYSDVARIIKDLKS